MPIKCVCIFWLLSFFALKKNTNRCADGNDDDGVVELLAGLCRRGPMYDDEIFAVNYVADEIVGDAFDFRLQMEMKAHTKKDKKETKILFAHH